VSQELVQEQFDFLVLQSFHLNLVSLGQHTSFQILNMLSEKVYRRSEFRRQFSEVYGLLFLLLSNQL